MPSSLGSHANALKKLLLSPPLKLYYSFYKWLIYIQMHQMYAMHRWKIVLSVKSEGHSYLSQQQAACRLLSSLQLDSIDIKQGHKNRFQSRPHWIFYNYWIIFPSVGLGQEMRSSDFTVYVFLGACFHGMRLEDELGAPTCTFHFHKS